MRARDEESDQPQPDPRASVKPSSASSGRGLPDILFMEEMEALSVKLKEKEQELREIEAGILNEAQKWPQGERAHLYFQLQAADDRYCRLLEAHRRLTRVNQSLEDKLLRLADKFESEKNALVAALSHTTQQLAETHVNLRNTREELERYKADCNLAVNLLQCRSSNFLSQRIESLPSQFQEKVKGMMDRRVPSSKGSKSSRCPGKVIKVPIPTFPPTAMVFTVPSEEKKGNDPASEDRGKSVDYVSAAILGKVMEERAKEREEMWKKRQQNQKFHCESCVCFGHLGLDKALAGGSSVGGTSDSEPEPEVDVDADLCSEDHASLCHENDPDSISNDLDSIFIDMPVRTADKTSRVTSRSDGWKDSWMHGRPSDEQLTSVDGCDPPDTSVLVSVHRPPPHAAKDTHGLDAPMQKSFPSETPV